MSTSRRSRIRIFDAIKTASWQLFSWTRLRGIDILPVAAAITFAFGFYVMIEKEGHYLHFDDLLLDPRVNKTAALLSGQASTPERDFFVGDTVLIECLFYVDSSLLPNLYKKLTDSQLYLLLEDTEQPDFFGTDISDSLSAGIPVIGRRGYLEKAKSFPTKGEMMYRGEVVFTKPGPMKWDTTTLKIFHPFDFSNATVTILSRDAKFQAATNRFLLMLGWWAVSIALLQIWIAVRGKG